MQSETGTVDYAKIKQLEGKTKSFGDAVEETSFNFSKRVVGNKGDLMEKRNQRNAATWERQHALAKIQEWAVCKLLQEYGCSDVDWTFHKKPKYDPDLILGEWKLHCKSVDINAEYGVSFTFQAGFETNDYDKIFDRGDEHDVVICGTVDTENRIVKIVDVNLWSDIKPYLTYVKGRDKWYLEGIKLFYDPHDAIGERKITEMINSS